MSAPAWFVVGYVVGLVTPLFALWLLFRSDMPPVPNEEHGQ